MKINIEPIRKKEAVNVIEFDYEIEESVRGEYLALLNAEQINFIRINGSVSQKNGFPAIDYEINAAFEAGCARCNKHAPQTVQAAGGKYLADTADEKGDNDEYYTLENPGMIDLREFMTEFLALEVPLRYLCAEDCKGLCQICGLDLNTGECGCDKKQTNPAFKVLDDFFK